MNGSEKYKKRIEITERLVKATKKLKREHDEKLILQRKYLKQSQSVKKIRDNLNNIEQEFADLYPNIE